MNEREAGDMRTGEHRVSVSSDAYRQIMLLCRAWNTTPSTVVDRVLADYARGPEPRRLAPVPPPSFVHVHARYEGVRVDGIFDRASRGLTITTGDLEGKEFKSPSGAAMALVRHLNPDVHNNRNGWDFWTVTDSGLPLKTLRYDGRDS